MRYRRRERNSLGNITAEITWKAQSVRKIAAAVFTFPRASLFVILQWLCAGRKRILQRKEEAREQHVYFISRPHNVGNFMEHLLVNFVI